MFKSPLVGGEGKEGFGEREEGGVDAGEEGVVVVVVVVVVVIVVVSVVVVVAGRQVSLTRVN